MKISLKDIKLSQVECDLVVIPLQKDDGRLDRGLYTNFAQLGGSLAKTLEEKLQSLKFKPEEGRSFLLTPIGASKAKSILVCGLKESEQSSTFSFYKSSRDLGSLVCRHAKELKAQSVVVVAPFEKDTRNSITALIEGVILGQYRFEKYRSKKEKYKGIRDLTIISNKRLPGIEIRQATTTSDAVMLARDLINMSPRDCTPRFLMETAKEIARKGNLKAQVYDRARLEELGAGSLLAVAQGSEEPPFLISMKYKPPRPSERVIALVGKGITFDSGGLSIKPATSMEEMKGDMSGAATVLAVMQALSILKPAIEVRAYIPTTENMVSGRATRPGDVVTAMNGKTIEILNTDAEGRLILADALTLASREGATTIIDVATLTGSCVVALGELYAGSFSDDEDLVRDLQQAADFSGERLWRLPLAQEYRELLKSPVADLKNIGGKWGGSITAGLFLSEFVNAPSWAHLDIAGPAMSDKDRGHIKKGGVGFGVSTLIRYVMEAANRVNMAA